MISLKHQSALKRSYCAVFAGLLLVLSFTGCMKDKNLRTFTMHRPQYTLKQEVKDNAALGKPQTLKDLGSFALYDNTMYITERNQGIHVIDYSNPANPVNRGFIPVPGNQGLSIRNNVMYADCFCDLFVFKINSKENIQFQASLANAFPSRMSPNQNEEFVVTTWIDKDTTVSEEYYNNYMHYEKSVMLSNTASTPGPNTPGNQTSVGSSMAVFTIVNDFLYTVDNSNLNTFSLSDPMNPVKEHQQQVSWNVETIFPFKDKLFIGSMTGMFIYSISDPVKPSLLGQFNHARVCDPVIADDRFAFVTLRNGSQCGGFVNQLDVINIENLTSPVLVKSYPFSNPHGLSKDGIVLFVCDGNDGLKVVDASDINNLQVRQTIATGKTIDVVAYGQLAFVMLDNAIRIYSYDQQFNVQLLGSIAKN